MRRARGLDLPDRPLAADGVRDETAGVDHERGASLGAEPLHEPVELSQRREADGHGVGRAYERDHARQGERERRGRSDRRLSRVRGEEARLRSVLFEEGDGAGDERRLPASRPAEEDRRARALLECAGDRQGRLVGGHDLHLTAKPPICGRRGSRGEMTGPIDGRGSCELAVPHHVTSLTRPSQYPGSLAECEKATTMGPGART